MATSDNAGKGQAPEAEKGVLDGGARTPGDPARVPDSRRISALRRKIEYLEKALRIAEERPVEPAAPPETELGALEERARLLAEACKRARAERRALDKTGEIDLGWIRDKWGSKISREEIVRAVRSDRDAR